MIRPLALVIFAYCGHSQEPTVSELQAAISANPNDFDAYLRLTDLYGAKKDHRNAVATMSLLLVRVPNVHSDGYWQVANNIGVNSMMYGDNRLSARSLMLAQRLKPRHGQILEAIGDLAQALKQVELALRFYRAAGHDGTHRAEVWEKVAYYLQSLTRRHEAEEAFKMAIRKGASGHGLYYGFGELLRLIEKNVDALEMFQKAHDLKPDSSHTMSAFIATKMGSCVWSDYSTDKIKLQHIVSAQLARWMETKRRPDEMMSIIQGWHLVSEDQVLALAQAQADSLTQAVASVYPSIKFSYPVDNRGSVIRIGYVSGTGFTEPYRADQLIQDLYPLHDRSKFEVWCYATMEGDDARKPRVDAIRLCDKFFKVHTGDGLEAASMINSANIHLLADIHVYRSGAKPDIFALKPSPLQINFHGQPCTAGADFEQYILGDRFVVAPDYAHWVSEKVVVMPQSYFLNDYLLNGLGRQVQTDMSEVAEARRKVGLTEHGFVLCSFNDAFKFEPISFDSWMQVLRDVPGSVMWFQRNPPGAEPNLKKQAEARGIDSARLHFSPRFGIQDHLWYKGACDLFMDSPFFNGHTTVGDALWAGIPTLALPHTQFFQRVSASAAVAVNLPELVAKTHEDYTAIAISLGRNRRKHRQLIERYRASKTATPFFDSRVWVQDYEARVRRMWDVYVQHKQAMHII